jgi:hypothetical protein
MKKVLLTLSALSILLVSCKKNEFYGSEVQPVSTTIVSTITSTTNPNSIGCTMWIFKAGTNSPYANGWYTPCGSTIETTIKELKAGESVTVCLRNPNGWGKGLSGIGSTITYKSECTN